MIKLKMSSFALGFEVQLPPPDSPFATWHVIDYIRHPHMLKLLESSTDFPLASYAEIDKIVPEPMPLVTHKTVMDYARYLDLTFEKRTITVQVPVPSVPSAVRGLEKARREEEEVLRKKEERRVRCEELRHGESVMWHGKSTAVRWILTNE